jgi:class 3 adenylate cyclase
VDASASLGASSYNPVRLPSIPEDHRIRFWVGINLGDVIVDGDDIFGDGVNVAARLEALSEPGGMTNRAGLADANPVSSW